MFTVPNMFGAWQWQWVLSSETSCRTFQMNLNAASFFWQSRTRRQIFLVTYLLRNKSIIGEYRLQCQSFPCKWLANQIQVRANLIPSGWRRWWWKGHVIHIVPRTSTRFCQDGGQGLAPSACSFPPTRGKNPCIVSRTAGADPANCHQLTGQGEPVAWATSWSTADYIMHQHRIYFLWTSHLPSRTGSIATCRASSSYEWLGGTARPFHRPSRAFSAFSPLLSHLSPWPTHHPSWSPLWDIQAFSEIVSSNPMADGVPRKQGNL